MPSWRNFFRFGRSSTRRSRNNRPRNNNKNNNNNTRVSGSNNNVNKSGNNNTRNGRNTWRPNRSRKNKPIWYKNIVNVQKEIEKQQALKPRRNRNTYELNLVPLSEKIHDPDTTEKELMDIVRTLKVYRHILEKIADDKRVTEKTLSELHDSKKRIETLNIFGVGGLWLVVGILLINFAAATAFIAIPGLGAAIAVVTVTYTINRVIRETKIDLLQKDSNAISKLQNIIEEIESEAKKELRDERFITYNH
jgi:hypothetical protein